VIVTSIQRFKFHFHNVGLKPSVVISEFESQPKSRFPRQRLSWRITLFAGQLAANHSFFQDKSQNGGAKSQFGSHFLAGGSLDLS
jgi:hypothetical protein